MAKAKKVVKKKATKKAAKKSVKKAVKKSTARPADKPRTKTEIFRDISENTGLTRQQVASVFDEMGGMIEKDLGNRGPGVFSVPGLMKITVVKKPAVKAHTRPDPFNPGQMMKVKAKPARKQVKVRPLKGLKDMV